MIGVKRSRYVAQPESEVDVLLIGAGFSRALGAPMPLTRELSASVVDDLEERGLSEALTDVPFAKSDFEKALTFLAERQPWLSESDWLRNRALFLDVGDSIHRVLVRAQLQLVRQHPECPGWLHQLICWMHMNRAIVITLNYDTLIEMAAGEFMIGPSAPYISKYLRPFRFPVREISLGNDRLKTLQLLKLHGSLHWTYSGTEQFFGQSIEDHDLSRWSIAAADFQPFSLEDGRVPLIIPPTLNKNKYFDNEKVRSLWERAALALAYARRVFCVGYSLPAGDMLMQFLLHSAKVSERRIPFWIINCDARASGHYSELLPSWYELKDDFVQDKNLTVVSSFAEALTSGALDSPESCSDIADTFTSMRTAVQSANTCGELERNIFDDNPGAVMRVDRYGVLFRDLTEGGERYWPWWAVEKIVQIAKDGKFCSYTDNPAAPQQALKQNVNIYGTMYSLLSALIRSGVLRLSIEGNSVCIRPAI